MVLRGRAAGPLTGALLLGVVTACSSATGGSAGPAPGAAARPATSSPSASASTVVSTTPAPTSVPPGTAQPTTGGPTTTAAAQTVPCGVDLSSPVIAEAVTRLRPAFDDPELQGDPNVQWSPDYVNGNYDPCATLSGVTVTITGATGSSPVQVLMFHEGVYQGTGTYDAYGSTSVDLAASTDDTVVVDYRYTQGDESNADASGLAVVRYRWVDDRVEMLDQLPPEATGG